MSAMIKEADKHDRFRLVFQPIANLMRTADDEKYEVFLRMLDENGKFIPPNQFLPAAVRSGQIAHLERWVIAKALQVLAKRSHPDRNTSLFINLSGATLGDHGLVDWLQERLDQVDVPRSALVFELCEPDITGQIGDGRQFTQSLERLGCRIAIDHFGHSANSFNYLKQIPASFLKLDREYLALLKQGDRGIQAVRALVEKAREMDKRIIAEFVENAAMLSNLWQCQIDYIQGHFLQQPSARMAFDFEGVSM
jgi:EAL domain-containing protein (putative c-di-GMP-specific phosphodiesterase class I)